MLEFEKVKISNFMSIGEAEVDLTYKGFTLISGLNNRVEDAAGSNGVGKTSIAESICWALTGETIRGHKEVINRYTLGTCMIELYFNFKGHRWVIRRGIDRSKEKTLEMEKDGKILASKGYRDAVDVLSKELPELTFKFINSVLILGQGLPGRFTNNSPAGRKAVLEELTNADFMISQVKDNIKLRQDNLNLDLRKVQDEDLVNKNNLINYKSNLDFTKKKLEDLNLFDLEKAKGELEAIKEKGMAESNKHEELVKDLEKKDKSIEIIRDNKNKLSIELDRNKAEVDSIYDAEYLEEKDALVEERDGKRSEVDKQLNEIEKEILLVNQRIDHCNSVLKGGFCPTCGQKMNSISDEVISKAKSDLISLKENLNTKSTKRDSLLDRLKEITDGFNKELADFKTNLDLRKNKEIKSLEDKFSKDLDTYETMYSGMLEERKAVSVEEKESQNRLMTLRTDYSTLRTKIESYQKQKDSLDKEVETFLEKIKEGETKSVKLSEKLEDLQNRLRVVKQMETFASRDFRGILLDGVITRLDQILKGYSQVVYGNQLTKFYQDGNSIVVEFDGKEYESLSGGEKQKLNILLQLSLRDLIIELSGVTGSFILLDEVFDGLDYIGCEKVIEVFQNLDTSIYIITHHQDLDIPYDRELRVVKNVDGVASVEIA